MKWVENGRNPEASIPIDAARSGDLENHGFGKHFTTTIMEKLRFPVLRWSFDRGEGILEHNLFVTAISLEVRTPWCKHCLWE